MKIYGHISAETMAQHEWVTLEDHLAAIEDELRRITALKADAKRLERRLATKEQVIIREMERAGKAEAENDRLRAALDKATGPVTDEEDAKIRFTVTKLHSGLSVTDRYGVNALLAARKEHGNG